MAAWCESYAGLTGAGGGPLGVVAHLGLIGRSHRAISSIPSMISSIDPID